MKEELIQQLFDKYLRGDYSASELNLLIDLLQQSEVEETLSPQLSALWEQMKADERVYDVDWRTIYSNVTSVPAVRKLWHIRRRYLVPVAAVLLIGILSVSIFSIFRPDKQLEYISSTVPNGEILEIILPDGSKITLNSGSTLKYPKKFNSDQREVFLNGEAYFEVKHSNKKPFIVNSGKIKAQVLGTSFNVSSYLKADKIEVTVLSGKVAVQDIKNKRSTFLLPEQRVTLDVVKGSFLKSPAKSDEALYWMYGRLIFDDATLLDVTQHLERKYKLKITLDNPELSKCKINAVFKKQPVAEILDIITTLTNTTYKQTKDSIKIYGKGCN